MKRRTIAALAAFVACAAFAAVSDLPRLYAETPLGIGKSPAAEIAELRSERTVVALKPALALDAEMRR